MCNKYKFMNDYIHVNHSKYPLHNYGDRNHQNGVLLQLNVDKTKYMFYKATTQWQLFKEKLKFDYIHVGLEYKLNNKENIINLTQVISSKMKLY